MNEALRQFARTRDEAAFERIVEKHAGLVYGAALRRTRDPENARDIAQNVFVILARKAESLASAGEAHSLGPWLHRTTLLETANHLRKEATRQRTMQEFTEQTRARTEGSALWEKATPVLDAVIDKLPDIDRQVILLRFYEDKSFREIGQTLGKSEGAVQKRASRALEKLSRLLRRKGVAVPAATLSSVLSTQLTQAAPAGLAAAIAPAAVALSAHATGGTAISSIILAIMNAKLQVAAVVTLIALAIPIATQQRSIAKLNDTIASLESAKQSLQTAAALPGGASPDGTSPSNAPANSMAPETPAETEVDLDALLEDLIAGINTVDFTRMMNAMPKIAKLDSDQLEKIFSMLEKRHLSEHAANQVASMLFDGIADEHYAFVLDYTVKNRCHFSNTADALRIWAEEDFEAASAWFEEQRKSGALQSKNLKEDAEAVVLGGLIAGAAKEDLDLALEMLNSANTKTGQSAIGKIVQRFLMESTEDHGRVFQLAARLEDDENRAYALKRYAMTLGAFTNFETAAAFAGTLDLPKEQLNEVHTGVADIGGTTGFHDRINWLVSVSQPEFVDHNVKEFTFDWATFNPVRAAKWVEGLDGQPYRDAAAEGVALGHLVNQRTADARRWAASIQDEERRNRLTKQMDELTSRNSKRAAQGKIIIIESTESLNQ